jgi:hypothetical protein
MHPVRIQHREKNRVKPDIPLICSVILLAAGLSLIFGYVHGNTSFAAAYPFSGTMLHVDFSEVGPGVLGGMALTALGALLLAWAFIAAIVNLVGRWLASEEPTERLLD